MRFHPTEEWMAPSQCLVQRSGAPGLDFVTGVSRNRPRFAAFIQSPIVDEREADRRILAGVSCGKGG